MTTEPKIRMLIVFAVALATVDCRVPSKPLSEADLLRNTVITYNDELWTNITDNYEWIYTSRKEYGTDSAMLLAYKTVCDRIDRFVPAQIPDVCDGIWNYARIKVELVGIQGLYGNFRKYQLEPPHKHKMFHRAWEDLAESVLHDSDTLHSVPSSLEAIHYLVTGSKRASKPSLYTLIGEVNIRL